MTKKELRQRVFEKYGGKCAYCGCDLTIDKMQMDHIIPKFRGDTDASLERSGIIRGTDDYDNLMPSCGPCNKRKSTFSIEEFRKQLEACYDRMMLYNANFRQMVRYGQIKKEFNNYEFYFEKIDGTTNKKADTGNT